MAFCRFFTDDIENYSVSVLKKKFTDYQHNKQIGNIKFKSEKAKNLSVPQNNTLWKDFSKKKQNNFNFILAVEQISVRYKVNDNLMVSFKTD